MLNSILNEAKNILERDPAAKSLLEALFCYPSLKAVIYHRLAHRFYARRKFFLARIIAHRARRITGIEIHPGAKIGKNLFIDHGMGVVIGETAEIGNNVTIFHGVTLGGLGSQRDQKRHPTIGDDVLIGAGAKILGSVVVGQGAKIGANAVVLKDVPPFASVVGVPGRELNKPGILAKVAK